MDDHDESLINLATGLIADYIANHSLADCGHDSIQSNVAVALRESAEPWGIEVTHFYLTDIADARTIRLLTDHNPPKAPTISLGM